MPSTLRAQRARNRSPSPDRGEEPPAAPAGADRPATIALLQSHSLTQLVQAELENLILSGELAPGAKLTELTLAARLGVSRGPIREAFRLLEEAGLVRTEKNRGVFVRQVPLDEALEIYDLRAAMDEWVGRRLATSASVAQIKELRGLVEAMERAVRDEDGTGYHRLNLAFHDRMVEMAGNAKLTAIYRRLIKELSLFRRLNLAAAGWLPVSVQEHRQILKAIAAQDAAAAGAAMFDHVMESRQRTLDHHAAPAEGRGPEPRKVSRDPRQRQKV
ncbi:MAG: phosphonate utilization associated transcriptional regulator [Ideonella sp.]|jgi:phosphonate utilization transcriptional regulator|nr:phosphonate utilization associated transcriptional regulator [Ideonella sp.]